MFCVLSTAFYFKRIFVLTFILLSISSLLNCDLISEDVAPEIELFQERRLREVLTSNLRVSAVWAHIVYDFVRVNTTFKSETDGGKTVLGAALDRFTFTCTAPYLTRWTSNIVPELPAQYIPANRSDENPILNPDWNSTTLLIENYVSQLILILPSGGSGHVQCESMAGSSNGTKLATRVYVYSLDGPSLAQTNSDERTLVTDTSKEFVVPCNANHPNVTAILETYGQINVSKVVGKYDPRIGFVIKGNGELRASYHCVYENESMKFFFYNPYSKEPDPLLDLAPTENNTLHFNIGGLMDEFPLGIFCSSINFPVHDIYMINCDSKDQCDWLKPCLYSREEMYGNPDEVNKNCTQNGITVKEATPIQRDGSVSQTSGTIQYPFTRGMVLCENSQGQRIQDFNYLLTGLDREVYWLLSSEIPKSAIIQIKEIEEVLHTDRPAVFVCDTLNFLLISNIRFAVEFSNGTRTFVDRITKQRNYTGDSTSMRKFKTDVLVVEVLGFSRRKVVVKVTTEMVRIFCFAPWNNSTEWINSSRKFEVRDIQAPVITVPEYKVHRINIFYFGDATRSLYCNVSGEPKPFIRWVIPPKLEPKFSRVGIARKNEETLRFPKIDPGFKGHWVFKCIAKNEYGFASQEFEVHVQELSNLSTGTVVGISFACIIILGLVIGLFIFIRKYLQAKRQLRNLTPEEIEEFRRGNPELLKERGSMRAHEKIQWMGFNPEFEIPESDLIIVKNSLLGEGQYGKVHRGFLKDEAVAVKTTKSNADVSYVKAILIELKILCYIETHPNIVHFFGAGLTHIQERIVLVVMELSPIGSLQAFLRKLGPNFGNLVKADGTIDTDLLPEPAEDQITTLHLIYWCKQISSAMNYLASKSVIHGDLATRNILLFKNNIVKITDFGLSRQLYGYEKYVQKQKVLLPWPWMSIESLRYREFSCHSDVWSFAVTVWEIFTLGQVPYAGILWTPDFVNQLVNGMRLSKHEHLPSMIYNKMFECWSVDPASRPSFETLFAFFCAILEIHSNEFGRCEPEGDLGVRPVVYTQT